MNENRAGFLLGDVMKAPEGWGRSQGREVYPRLVDLVEANPGLQVFRFSLEGVRRMDISFASETLIELARRYRGRKGFCLVSLRDPDLIENVEAAAARKAQPIMMWDGNLGKTLGPQPSQGTIEAFKFALERPSVRAAEYAKAVRGVSIANASTKFKQLWEQGFLLRREDTAESGGKEFVYFRIA